MYVFKWMNCVITNLVGLTGLYPLVLTLSFANFANVVTECKPIAVYATRVIIDPVGVPHEVCILKAVVSQPLFALFVRAFKYYVFNIATAIFYYLITCFHNTRQFPHLSKLTKH